jgi:hypothetical protein
MRTDQKKCGAHNVIHGLRETCPRCVEARRAGVLAGAAKAAAPLAPKEDPLLDLAGVPFPWTWDYPESRYDPNKAPGVVVAKEVYRPEYLGEWVGDPSPPEPFNPETYCPPGREALRRAGYVDSCYQPEDLDCYVLLAEHGDGTHLEQEIPGKRARCPDQQERFLAFAWETMALDAGLDGLLAIIEEEESDE